jgi:hypothetical protein
MTRLFIPGDTVSVIGVVHFTSNAGSTAHVDFAPVFGESAGALFYSADLTLLNAAEPPLPRTPESVVTATVTRGIRERRIRLTRDLDNRWVSVYDVDGYYIHRDEHLSNVHVEIDAKDFL